MAIMKKLLILGLTIPFISIFLMSHNAGALPFDVTNYNVERLFLSPAVDCSYSNNTSTTNQSYCSSGSNYNITSITTNSTYNYRAGDIISLYITVWNYAEGFDVSPLVPYLIQNNDFDLLEITQDVDGTYFDFDTGSITYNVGSNYENIDLHSNFYNVRYYKIVLKARKSNNASLGLSTTQSIGVIGGSYVRARLYWGLKYSLTETAENKEQEEATQNAVDDSEDAGDSSSSSAEGASASLLSAITGFFSVITSATPTNCVFNAPLNTHFGNQRLNVDLCSLNLPSQIGALTSIIAIGIIIPFAIHMFKKFINLFRSFQS